MEPRIDKEAKRLLDEADWGWDPQLRGFRRKARRKESTAAYDAPAKISGPRSHH